MMPIQLWLPAFQGGASQGERQRDLRRAHGAWSGHHFIWTVPGWRGPAAWNENGLKVGCVSGEALECFRILHVGDKGGIAGPAAAAFPNLAVDGLLDLWLGSDLLYASEYKPPRRAEVRIPTPVEGGVAYRTATLEIEATSVAPFRKVDRGGRRALAQWPPESNGPLPVSPAEESRVARGSAALDAALSLQFHWSGPFGDIAPLAITADDAFAQAQMNDVLKDAESDPDAARAKALMAARDWLAEGRSDVARAWLQPIIASEGENGAVFALSARLGFEGDTLDEAYGVASVREALRRPMQVRRALGVPGLMWALLVDRLERGPFMQTCQRCGKPVSGRRHKRFCSAEDDPACHRARARERQRKSRSRHS